jgi:hypothetical protein
MPMRSSDNLGREIELRRRALELQEALADDHVQGWGQLEHQRKIAALHRVESELATVGPDMDWAFNGPGISDGRITMRRFEYLFYPLIRTMRGTARDLLFVEGVHPTDAAVNDLIDPVFAGTFVSSFGIRLSRSSASEQLSLLEAPLFDRTAERVLDVFRAARAGDPVPAVLDQLSGMRRNTLNSFRQLSERLVEGGWPATIRWRGQTIQTVRPEDASVVVAAITQATPKEDTITVRATLREADLDTGSFHLRQSLPGSERDRDYRGKAAPDARSALHGIRLGSEVIAVLAVLTMDSPVHARPRETFVLQSIEEAQTQQQPDGRVV